MTTPPDMVEPLLAEFDRTTLLQNGVPDTRTRADRERCLHLLMTVLAGHVRREDVLFSPMGVEWTEVFDVSPSRPVPDERLIEAGWLPLDTVLTGRRTPSTLPRRWAVVEHGRVLAGVRLTDTPTDPVRAVLDRCEERSEVRLREVLELRELRRQGRPFPQTAPALGPAAEIESGLGGRLLAPWASGRLATPPTALGRPRRSLVVAISGVDGSGKSTMRAALAESLMRAGVPVSTVWVRPGMGLGRLIQLASWGKRLLGQDAAPGLHAMADPEGSRPASRRGPMGWTWAMLVTCSFLVGVWRQHLSAQGVVLYDRHQVDALATLDFAYEGVDLRLHHRLVRTLLPSADLRLYLEVPADVSVARKPDDVLGEHAVRRQLESYDCWLDKLPPVVRLDATLPTADLVVQVLDVLTAGGRARLVGRLRRRLGAGRVGTPS